jgi:hypothetical protein
LPSTAPYPSAVRVFAKSMHLLAAGWFLSIGWLWIAGVQQHIRRREVWPPNYGADILIEGLLSAVAIEIAAIVFVRWTGSAPDPALERREWVHAFWWALYPNVMLLITVYVMLEAGR